MKAFFQKSTAILTLSLVGVSILTVNALTVSGVSAAENPINEYSGPEVIKYVDALYPRQLEYQGNEGVVEVLAMVDKDGMAYEPIAKQSTHFLFERAAVDAVKRHKFRAATLNRVPIDSRVSIHVGFELKDRWDVTSHSFWKRYNRAMREFDSETPSEKRLNLLIRQMEGPGYLSAYAYGRLQLIKFLYAKHFEQRDTQIQAIRQVMLFNTQINEKNRLLNGELETALRRELLDLEVKAQRYGDALKSYQALLNIDGTVDAEVSNLISKVDQLKRNDQSFSINLSIDHRGFTSLEMLKRGFAIEQLEGSVEQLKLRCERRFKKLPYRTHAEYHIPPSWGACDLQILAQPGSSLQLLQF